MLRRGFFTRMCALALGLLTRPAQAAVGAPTGYAFDRRLLDYTADADSPETPARLVAVNDRFAATDLLRRLTSIAPLENPMAWVARVHTRAHIEGIARLGQAAEAAALTAALALGAVKAVCESAVRNAFCAIRPPGHHARNTGRMEGFCCYNNVAIAARYAQAAFGVERVLIVDWDFHHGNATQEAFYEDPAVLYFSTHSRTAYPGTGDSRERGKGAGLGYTINVPLRRGAGDEKVFAAWRTHLLPAAQRFRPGLVLVSAGFDSRAGDPLGAFRVSDQGYAALTRMAMAIAAEHAGGRLVSLLEGGYDPQGLALACEAHVRQLMAAV